jgi:hypothetical protein
MGNNKFQHVSPKDGSNKGVSAWHYHYHLNDWLDDVDFIKWVKIFYKFYCNRCIKVKVLK